MISETSSGTILDIVVQPRASKTEYVGIHGDSLKFRVAAPPVDGAANTLLLRFLADRFSLPIKAVVLCGGEHGRCKRVLLKGVTTEDVQRAFSLRG